MAATSDKIRLDHALVARGLVGSRARARDLILRGKVSVAGREAVKPSLMVAAGDTVEVDTSEAGHVSRGALKLAAALDRFGFEAKGRAGLDIGASTGGFTETLLAAGAWRVYAVENGHGQLHPRLADDPRVVSLEGQDARTLTAALVPDPIGAMVADVSFISLTKALPAALALARPDCWLVALIKPQFEAERAQVPRTGVIKDAKVHREVVERIETWLGAQPGWQVMGTIPSPILGGEGNTEFLIGAVHGG